MKKESIIIIGGDKRQEHIYDVLSADGYNCVLENQSAEHIEEKLSTHRYVILPVPVSKDNKNIYCKNENFLLSCNELAKNLTDSHIVFGGGLGKELTCVLNKNKTVYYDFNNNEDFLVYNAFLTAQGALKLLLDNTEKTLCGRKVLITGFGRIGKSLAILLKPLNLSVTVCIRNDNQQNLAECLGFDTIKYDRLKDTLADTDFIFNTVPVRILDTEDIKTMKNNSIYFELASAPYGADRSLFSSGAKFVDGGSLPGKYTPHSAGEKIAKIIENLIQRSDINGK